MWLFHDSIPSCYCRERSRCAADDNYVPTCRKWKARDKPPSWRGEGKAVAKVVRDIAHDAPVGLTSADRMLGKEFDVAPNRCGNVGVVWRRHGERVAVTWHLLVLASW
jgi:hypothetical protein